MRRKWLICGLLAALTLAVYWPVRTHDFIAFDDPQFTTENAIIKEGLTRSSFRYALTTPVVANWHPVTTMSHILDCQFFGIAPGAHHLVSLGFHAANAVLLFLILQRLTNTLWRSAIVAAVFSLHPLRVESVAWIAERKDVLSAFFFILTIWAYANYVGGRRKEIADSSEPEKKSEAGSQEPKVTGQWSRGPVFWYILALMLFALGLMSKPMLVTLPFVLLLLDYWPLKRFQIPHFKFQRFLGYPRHPTPPARASQSPKVSWFVLEKLPFFAFSAISCWITLALQRGAAEQNAAILIEDRLANAIISYSRYLGKLFWPTKLTILYPHPISSYDPSSVWLDWQIGVAALALFIVSLGCLWQVRSRPYLAVGWFWFLGTLVPVIGLVQVGEQAMADRYTYIPLIGPVIGLVWFVSELPLLDPVRRRLFSILATVIVIGCTMLTRRQLNYWRNTVTLFAHALEITPNNASAEVSLGVGLEKQGKPTEAMTHYRRALALNPSYAIAHYNVGQLLRKNGAWAEAAEHYSIVVDLKPYDVPARVNFANALESLGRDEEAIVQFEKTLSLDPNLVEALNNLAWLLASDADARLRNGARAVELAQHACELTHFREVIMVGTLAAAYAEAGRFPEAVATAEKACALASKLGEPELLARNQQLLEGYRSGRPYHEVGH